MHCKIHCRDRKAVAFGNDYCASNVLMLKSMIQDGISWCIISSEHFLYNKWQANTYFDKICISLYNMRYDYVVLGNDKILYMVQYHDHSN